jgi:hypothetical protein
MRPVEQVAGAVGRDAEQAADDRDRVRLRVVAQEVEVAGGQELPRKLVGRRAQGLDRAWREGGGDELADPRVLGRLEPKQAPALGVPEGLPARGERLGGGELVLAPDVAEVAAEPPVAQARAYLGVPGDEPAVELLLVEERRFLAQRGKARVRVGQELRVGGVSRVRSRRRS